MLGPYMTLPRRERNQLVSRRARWYLDHLDDTDVFHLFREIDGNRLRSSRSLIGGSEADAVRNP